MVKLPAFHDTHYLAAHRIYPTDRFLDRLLLWMIPPHVTPNHITLVRFIAIPAIIILLWLDMYAWGIPLFLFAALTDAIDGALARTRNMITPWGMLFDPLADKLLIIPVVLLMISAHLSVVLAAAVVGIEIIIILCALRWRHTGRVVQANVWGKIKMLLQVCSVSLLLISAWLTLPLMPLASAMLIASVFLSVVSLARYGI